MKFISKFFILLPIVLLFWLLMALAADGYLKHLAAISGRYTAFSYAEYIPFYCAASLAVLSLLYGMRRYTKIAHGVLLALFTVLLWLFIEDDLKSGRPIIPEILFIVVMVVFHTLLLKGLMWLTAQSQATQ